MKIEIHRFSYIGVDRIGTLALIFCCFFFLRFFFKFSGRNDSAGTLLLQALFDWESSRKDPLRSFYASVILSHVLRKNDACKNLALRVHVPESHDGDTSDEAISLLHKLVYSLTTAARTGADVRVQIGFLCLLATWLYNHSSSVAEFLKESSGLGFVSPSFFILFF